MRDLFAIERHVQLMMVAHAYLEIQSQEARATSSEPEATSPLVTFKDSIKPCLGAPRSLRSSTLLSVASNSILSITV